MATLTDTGRGEKETIPPCGVEIQILRPRCDVFLIPCFIALVPVLPICLEAFRVCRLADFMHVLHKYHRFLLASYVSGYAFMQYEGAAFPANIMVL